MSEMTLHMLKEQWGYSSKKVEALKHDKSKDGTKELNYHAAIIQNIKTRIETVIESQSSMKETEEILFRLYR